MGNENGMEGQLEKDLWNFVIRHGTLIYFTCEYFQGYAFL